MNYIALAIAPGIAISLYIFYKDIYNLEPRKNVIISFLLGCLAIFPAAIFEQSFDYLLDNSLQGLAIFCYGIIAFSEEFCKFIGLRFYAYNRKSFDEPLDGIIYSVMVSMGFATIENILYVLKYAAMGQGLQVGLLRMFLSVPAHATFGVIMGYFVGKAKFDKKNSFFFMLLGLLGAIFFHGTFDFFIFLNQRNLIGFKAGNDLIALGALVSFTLSLILSRKLIKQHRIISKQMYIERNKPVITIRNATLEDIPLIRELTFKIWPVTYAPILTHDQIDYMLVMMYGESSLKKQMMEGCCFIIVYNKNEPVGFASYQDMGNSIFKLHKIYILPSEQGKGTGRYVLDYIFNEIKNLGGMALQLQVNRNNNAKIFYETLGFSVIQEADFDIGNGFFMNDYVMEKQI